MIAKLFAIICLFGLTRAGHLYGGYGGYGSYGGYAAVAPAYAYSAPLVTKSIAYTPASAVSHVSQYSVHSAPVVKSYAPVSYAYAAPYAGHSYAAPLSYGYGGYGYGGYGYGGYGSKYAW